MNTNREKELKRKFKLACTPEEKPMSEVVTTLIEQQLTQKETDSQREVSEEVSEENSGNEGGQTTYSDRSSSDGERRSPSP